ncbi:MAG TPA: bifunctional 4-hydroxy-2-oxoglutarate aldolase/2-dehydro-3-deoxy-phosphogluconate aldolase [Acidimicrobiales bacterium]|nr:bifunctional 4-hydroxy-2-oxoglutarate aldolase/2-dehydro-3-deoxy-phosphogluconate aldolase [Acidimicrobiales bacterium]
MSDLVERISMLGVVPVIELASVDQAEPLLDALSAGGLPAAEITLRTPAGAEAIGLLRRSHPEALVGAGTVRTAKDARRVIEGGAQFVVSPGTDPEVLDVCRELGILALPGACTPTEIGRAVSAGAPLVKFFPAGVFGGTSFLKAVAGPFPDVRFVPTGGVSPANLAEYLGLPSVAACGGTWLAKRELLADGRYAEVEKLAAEAVAIVRETRRA